MAREKLKKLKNVRIQKKKMNLLLDFGVPLTLNKKTVGKVSKFIQTVCFPGMKDESVTEAK